MVTPERARQVYIRRKGGSHELRKSNNEIKTEVYYDLIYSLGADDKIRV
jgi:hypothetical protein